MTPVAHTYQKILIIRAALFFATMIMIGLGIFLNQQNGANVIIEPANKILDAAFIGIALFLALFSFKILPLTLGQTSPDDPSYKGKLSSGTIIQGAIAEMIVLAGLCNLLINHTLLNFLMLAAISVATHVFTFPDKKKWESNAT